MQLSVLVLLPAVFQSIWAAVDPSDPCGRKLPFSSNLTIETQADADAFSTCLKTDLDIVISKNFPGDFIGKIQQAGKSIYIGHLTDREIEDSTLTGVSFPDLTYVDDDIQISGARGLKTLSFPKLDVIQSSIAIRDLPNLSTFDMFSRLRHASYISITNTGLRRIEWDRFGDVPKLISFRVTNNTNLRELSIPALENISGGGLYIHGNGRLRVYSRIREVQFIEISGVESWMEGSRGLDSLRFSANRGASFPSYRIFNNTFDTLSFEFLQYTNGSIRIYDNPNLASLSFPSLYRVNQELEITDNPALKKMNYSTLGNLKTISSINLTGSFEEIELPLPQIRPYSLIIGSTANISCAPFDDAWQRSWVTDLYGCASNGVKMQLETNSTRGRSKNDGNVGRSSRHLMLLTQLAIILSFLLFF